MDQRAAPSVNRIPVPSEVRVTGHFGELVQGRMGETGPVALVTLRCPVLGSRAGFHPGGTRLIVRGDATAKIQRAAVMTLARCTGSMGGELTVSHDAPAGGGAGTSTSDALAAVRAIARAHSVHLTPDEEAWLCHASEGAVDPLMYGPEVLFASRTGQVLRRLPPLPALNVVGGFAGPGTPTNARDDDFPDMSEVFATLSSALEDGDGARIGRAARRSAEANQARNPNAYWDAVVAIGTSFGALGPVVSHTGSAIGLLFAPEVDIRVVARSLHEAGLAQVVQFRTGNG